MFFDSHCHLTAEQFDADRDAVIQRARDAGVTHILTLATDVASSRAAIALAEKYDGVYAAVGIHPESVTQAAVQDLEQIRELARHPRVVAIGEIGLDYYWDKTTADLQQDWFEKQLELALELNLPVAVHDRDAHAKITETLERMFRRLDANEDTRRSEPAQSDASTGAHVRNAPRSQPIHGVLHAFSGDLEMAHAAFALGFFVSFGGPVTFKNNRHAPDLIRALPLEKILIETDSPYLAPHPYRGKRNEPGHVKLVAERIAELLESSPDDVAAQTTRNAGHLFRIM